MSYAHTPGPPASGLVVRATYRCQAPVRDTRTSATQLSGSACGAGSPTTYRCQAPVQSCDAGVTGDYTIFPCRKSFSIASAIATASTIRTGISGRGSRRIEIASGSKAAWLRWIETAAWLNGRNQVG